MKLLTNYKYFHDSKIHVADGFQITKCFDMCLTSLCGRKFDRNFDWNFVTKEQDYDGEPVEFTEEEFKSKSTACVKCLKKLEKEK